MPLPTIEEICEWFDYNLATGIVSWKKHPGLIGRGRRTLRVGDPVGAPQPNGYLVVGFRGNRIYVHRLAWALFYGEWPQKHLDHIDHNRVNNAIDNLREVTRREQSRNMSRNRTNTSGRMGVCRNKGRGKDWLAYIGGPGDRYWLGSFDTFEEAVAAREEAEHKLGYHPNHGRLASPPPVSHTLNIPDNSHESHGA